MADMKVAMIFEAVDRASKVIRGIIGAQQKLNALAGAGMANVAAGAGKAAKGMAVAGAMVAGVAASAAAAANALIEPGRQFERYNVQLAALEGSADKGKAALGWITDFATRTPLELDQVVESYVRLKSFGLDPTQGALQGLVDTMAANGKGAEHLDGLVIALGQAWTKGKLQGEEAMQLMERGVPVWDLLAEATGKNAAQLQEMASKGKLGRDAIQKLIDIMSRKYAGASDAMSKTFDGIMSNLSDAWLQFELAVNNAGLFDFMKGKAQELLTTVKAMAADGSLATLAKTVSDTIVNVLTATWQVGQGIAGVMMTIGQGLAFVADAIGGWERLGAVIAGLALAPALMSVVAGIAQMAAGLAMIAPLVLSPIGLVAAAVAAIGAAAYLLVDDWQPVLDWLSGALDGVVAAAQAAADWLAGMWAAITPPEGWAAAIRGTLASAWEGIRAVAAPVVDWLAGAWAAMTPAEGWAAAISGAAASAWAGVQSAWSTASTWFSDLWASIAPNLDLSGLTLDGAMTATVDALAAAWGKVSAAVDLVRTYFQGLAAGFSAYIEPLSARFTSIGESFGRIGETWGRIGDRLGRAFGRLGETLGPLGDRLAGLFGGVDEGRVGAFAEAVGRVAGFLADIAAIGLEGAVRGIELLVAGLDKLVGLATGEIAIDWPSLIPALDWSAIVPPIEWGKIFDFSWVDVLPKWDWGAIVGDAAAGIKSAATGAWDGLTGLFGGGEAAAAPVSAAAEAVTEAAARMPTALPIADPAALREAARLTETIAAGAAAIAATDTTAAFAAIGAVDTKAQAIVGSVRSAMAAVEAAVAGVDLSFHGARLMDTLAAGIRARAAAVVEAIRATMAEVRAFLPSSPAKVGPLSDIHKLKFTETIAASIRPAPMVEAMRRAAAMTMAAAAISAPTLTTTAAAETRAATFTPAVAAAEPSFRAPPAASPAAAPAAGGITIHAPLTLTIQGGAAADMREEFEARLREHARQIADLVAEELRRRERREH